MLNTPQTKKIIFIFILIAYVGIFGRDLNPWNNRMFMGHDETQAARSQEFYLNLKEGNIPPRIAPHFSFNMGYPVFNYYAQFPYWIVSLFQFLGFSVLSAMKLAFLLFMVIGFIGMFLFLRNYFSFYPSLLGSLLYSTSPYIAVDALVRGNLGEIAAFAMIPWGLYMLLTNTHKRFLLSSLVLSFLFTAHNVLSLASLIIMTVFAFLTPKRTLNLMSIGMGLLLGSYFLIPAILELGMVQASNVAKNTNYADHFLCLKQVWFSPWGFAGSAKGCDQDGMSFMLGKISIILGVSGIFVLIYAIYKQWKKRPKNAIEKMYEKKQIIFLSIMTIGALFLTTDTSLFVWKLFEPVLALFQFPWRFLVFVLFGLSFFAAYAISHVTNNFKPFTVLGIVIISLFLYQKYFAANTISYGEFQKRFLSESYIKNDVVYKIPEYVPKTVEYNSWKELEKNPKKMNMKLSALVVEDKPFSRMFMSKSADPVIANIHYAPYWKIIVDYLPFVPTRFDKYGRPFIQVSKEGYTSIQIKYEPTTIETMSTVLSVGTFLVLLYFFVRQFTPSWKKIITKT